MWCTFSASVFRAGTMKNADGVILAVGTRSKKIGEFDMGTDDNAPMSSPPAGACGPSACPVGCSTDLGGAGGTCGDVLTGTLPQPYILGMEAWPPGTLVTGTDRRRGRRGISSVVANLLGTSNLHSELTSGAGLSASGIEDEQGTSGLDDEPSVCGTVARGLIGC